LLATPRLTPPTTLGAAVVTVVVATVPKPMDCGGVVTNVPGGTVDKVVLTAGPVAGRPLGVVLTPPLAPAAVDWPLAGVAPPPWTVVSDADPEADADADAAARGP